MSPRMRTLREQFAPWNRQAAPRAAVGLMAVASAVTALDYLVAPKPPDLAGRIAALAGPVLFGILSVFVYQLSDRLPDAFYAGLPMFGVLAIVSSGLVTRDATAATQLFFCLPLLYAATQLRTVCAYVVAALAVVADGVLVWSLLPFVEALRDWYFATITFTVIGVLLVRARRSEQQLAVVLRQQATIDPLTGLVTRRVLDEAAQSAIAGAVGDEGSALIMLDVDRFKAINDTFGHPVGDEALVHVAAVIGANARKDAVISRLGGDEIAVLLPGCDYPTAVRRAGQIVAAISTSPLLLDGGRAPVPLSISAGVAHAPTHADDLTSLYAAADSALYIAKNEGRNRVGSLAPTS
jgi:diguanylate cyclase (GGDEF)-like protein